jgi:hypothetical protein
MTVEVSRNFERSDRGVGLLTMVGGVECIVGVGSRLELVQTLKVLVPRGTYARYTADGGRTHFTWYQQP